MRELNREELEQYTGEVLVKLNGSWDRWMMEKGKPITENRWWSSTIKEALLMVRTSQAIPGNNFHYANQYFILSPEERTLMLL